MAKTWVAGWLSLSAAWLTHEIITFGYFRGFLTGERQLGFGVYPATLQGIILEALVICSLGAFVLLVPAYIMRSSKARIWVLATGWLLLCIWGYFQTAVGYTPFEASTWQWHEPFRAWMWSPWLTPSITLLGLLSFLWIVRRTVF